MAGVSSIITEVTARLGNRTDIASRVPVWLNDGYFELLLSPRFSFYELDATDTSITTVSATRNYAVTGITDLWFILSIRDTTNSRRIMRSGFHRFDKILQPSASGQNPTRYVHYGTNLELDPTPGGAYALSIRYRKRPSELAAGGSTGLGREWDEVLTLLAVIKGWEALEQTDKAATQRQLLEGLLSIREEPMRLEDMDAEYGVEVAMR